MNAYRNNYTHTAVIISLLLHGILVVLLLSAIIIKLSNQNKIIKKSKPAPVSVEWDMPGGDEEPIAQEVIVPEVPQTKPLVSDYVSGKLPVPREFIKPAIELTPAKQEPSKPIPIEIPLPEKAVDVVPTDQPFTSDTEKTQQTIKPRVRKRRRVRRRGLGKEQSLGKMSPKELLTAFKKSVQKSINNPYENPYGNYYDQQDQKLTDNQRNAIARTRNLGDQTFHGRIDDVLARTFSMFAKPIKCTDNIDCDVEFRVIINPNGTIADASVIKGTGNAVIDDEIVRVMLNMENIPLPSRYTKERYIMNFKSRAVLHKGDIKLYYGAQRKPTYGY